MKALFKILFVLLVIIVIFLLTERSGYKEQFKRSDQIIDSLGYEITHRDSIIAILDTELDSMSNSNKILKWKYDKSKENVTQIEREYEIKKAQRNNLPIDSIVDDIAKFLHAKY